MSSEETDPHRTNERIVEAYRARDSIQASMIVALLAEAGIKSQVAGGFSEAGKAEIVGWSAAPQILVFESDREQARTLIEAAEQSAEASPENEDI